MVGETVLKKQSSLQHIQDMLLSETSKKIYKEQERLKRSENTVRLLNPDNVLKRGFTLTLKDGKIVKSANDLNIGDELSTRFADGNVQSKITNKNK